MSNYGYLNARLRGQHSRLLTLKDYEELLALPDLAAMERWLESSQYAKDWHQAKTRYKGLEAVEQALESNFARTAGRIQSMSQGWAHKLIRVLMRRWDLHNILAVVRGIHQGWSSEQVGRGLWPVGNFGPARLAELARQTDLGQVADTLATWGEDLAAPLNRHLPQYRQNKNLAALETEILRFYYGQALSSVRGWGHGPRLLRRLLQQEIDLHNVKTYARLSEKPGVSSDEALRYFIAGGRYLDQKTYLSLFDDRLRRRTLSRLRSTPLHGLLSAGDDRLQEEVDLNRTLSEQRHRLFRGDPLAIDVAVGFLWRKFHEVSNLRLLARAKVFGPGPEALRSDLLLF